MGHTRSAVVMCVVLASLAAGVSRADAQQNTTDDEPRLRVSASAAAANLFRIEDRSFGRTLNVGGGAGVRLRKQLWLDFEANRFISLEPEAVRCGLVNVECTGGGRSGYSTATAGSIALTYHFAPGGVRAFVSGGYGFIRARGFSTVTFGGTGEQVEHVITDHGWGPTAGAGVHIPIASRWALEPMLHIYGADAPNLTVLRGAVALSRVF